jgi:hypothetical protein
MNLFKIELKLIFHLNNIKIKKFQATTSGNIAKFGIKHQPINQSMGHYCRNCPT